jgi:hypothetical protein
MISKRHSEVLLHWLNTTRPDISIAGKQYIVGSMHAEHELFNLFYPDAMA